MTKAWIFGPALVAILLLSWVLFAYGFEDHRNCVCESCRSTLESNQIPVGEWEAFSLPVTPSIESINVSHL